MLENGHISLHRSLLKWRWYQNGNTMRLFIHLLLTANWEDCDFERITVHRGQRVASRKTLSKETGMSQQEVRTAIDHLIATNEITSTPYAKYTVFTIKNYDQYQTPTNKSTSYQPAINHNLIKLIMLIMIIRLIISYLYLICLARADARAQKRSELETCAQMR